LFAQVLETRKEVLGTDHPDTLGTMSFLARTYREQGKFEEARSVLIPLVELADRRLGSNHNTTTDARIFLGYVLRRTGRYAEAEPPLRNVVSVCEKLTPGTWNLANVRSLLGASLAGQQKFTEAEPLLTTGLQGLLDHRKEIPASSLYFFDFAAEAVVRMYRDMGQNDKASSWEARLKSAPPQ
jgi:hypothetical protein